ncbi:hypothetical protein PAXRUDRAFT_135656, partial [Paxillus rubicundulus Ve08.2h10]
NTCSPEDITQWAGVSVATVINCMHHVMAAILDQHNQYIYMPSSHSRDIGQAQQFTKS